MGVDSSRPFHAILCLFTKQRKRLVLLDYLLPHDDEKLLYARDGWLIPTRTLVKESREFLLNRAKHWQLYRPKAILRSLSHVDYPYNCVGMIFAARRKWIDIDHLPAILEHD